MSTRQQQQRSSETEQQRTARLQQVSTRQRVRLSSETEDQMEIRRQRNAEAYNRRRQPSTHKPLLDQTVVAKLRKFHEELSGLEKSSCDICHEPLPGLNINLLHECR